MEPAGLAVGVLAIAGLFNNAVDCFEYVQIGRNFGQRYQTGLLILDGARLRLSRWGQSVGLSHELKDTQSLSQALESAQEVNQAEQILSQILELFADAEGISAKFQTRAGRSQQELLIHDAQVGLEPAALTLHNKMRDLSIKRQNQTPLRQKAKWALYEEKHFKRLIEDITSLVNDLIELFPAAQESQKKLCTAEVAEMNAKGNFPMLETVAKSQDKLLEEAIVEAMKQHSPAAPNVTFSGSHNSGFQLANNIGSISNLRWGGNA
ncbi:MAG: hypothetical protein Q9198_007057 [Flavoplaca austrocitrina]